MARYYLRRDIPAVNDAAVREAAEEGRTVRLLDTGPDDPPVAMPGVVSDLVLETPRFRLMLLTLNGTGPDDASSRKVTLHQ